MATAIGRARAGTQALFAVSLGFSTLVAAAPGAAAQGDPYGSTTTTTEAPGTEVSCQLSVGRARVGSTVGGRLSGTRPADQHRIYLGDRVVAEVTPVAGETDFGFTVPDMRPGNYVVSAVGATATAECTVPGGGVRFQVLPRTGGGGDGDADGDDGAVLSASDTAGTGTGTASTAVRSRGLALTGTEVVTLVLLGVALVAAGLVARNRALLRRASRT